MNKIQELMQQEISRQEFLRYIGVAILGIIGVSSLLQNLTSLSSSKSNHQESGGYGASPYGR